MVRPLAFLVLCLAAGFPAPVDAAGQRASAPPELVNAAVAQRNAREQARRTCADEIGLRERVLAGTARPAEEADAAAAGGCFGLITSFNMIPAGIPYAIGVACRPNAQLFRYGGLSLFYFAGSDVAPLNAEQAARDARALAVQRTFALAYNRAVLARADFPYHDLCRVAADDYSPELSEVLRPGEWGYRTLEETDAPIDIYEAARRGTLASLRRLVEARPINLHVPDLLGLTPLGWAVIYNRAEHARLLLEAGVHPYGEPYRERALETSPVMIAREERNRGMARLIQPFLDARGLSMPEVDPLLDRDRSWPLLFTQQPGWMFVGATLVVSAEGRVTDCHFQGPEGTEADCERARRSLFFLPAEDGSGRADRSSTFLHIPVNRP